MTAILKAETPAYGGYVIAREEGVIFIKGALPGEVVEASIDEKKRDYSLATVKGVIEPSVYRVAPPCPYFGDCGGCQLQYISYDKQVTMKEEVLIDCLKRIGGIEIALRPSLIGKDFHYRRRGQFKVSRDGRIGFYREGTRDIVDIEKCPLMVEELNEILGRVRASAPMPGIKELHITSGDSSALLVKGRAFDEGLAERFMGLGFSTVAFDDGSYRGKGHVIFDLDGLIYTVSPWSFFQSNWQLNNEIVRWVIEGAAMPGSAEVHGSPDEKGSVTPVLDLYAGAGNFSLPLSRIASRVVAVEENPDSIKDGLRNLSLNGIKNVKFISASAEKAKVGTKSDENFDMVVLDPPRAGLTSEAVRRVVELSPRRIIYLSCNPSTFARDLKKLKAEYEIDSVRLVDLFPNTYHIESIAFLSKKP